MKKTIVLVCLLASWSQCFAVGEAPRSISGEPSFMGVLANITDPSSRAMLKERLWEAEAQKRMNEVRSVLNLTLESICKILESRRLGPVQVREGANLLQEVKVLLRSGQMSEELKGSLLKIRDRASAIHQPLAEAVAGSVAWRVSGDVS